MTILKLLRSEFRQYFNHTTVFDFLLSFFNLQEAEQVHGLILQTVIAG